MATYEDYLNPKYFADYPAVVDLVQSAVRQSAFPKTPIWLGETSDAWHSGTANVSDRFVSSFLFVYFCSSLCSRFNCMLLNCKIVSGTTLRFYTAFLRDVLSSGILIHHILKAQAIYSCRCNGMVVCVSVWPSVCNEMSYKC